MAAGEYKLGKKEYMRQWRAKNKERILEYQREWARNNREKCKNWTDSWAKENPEKIKSYAREWARKHGSKKVPPEKARAYRKAWRDKNRGVTNAFTADRRAKLLQRTPSYADAEAIKFFYECCPRGCHVDHVIPLQGKAISGLHIETNLQWLPASDNLRKNNSWTGY